MRASMRISHQGMEVYGLERVDADSPEPFGSFRV